MEWIIQTLRQYPEIAIFLALAIGFWFGNLKFGSFSLGVVTSVLLAGVIIGQLKIQISPNVKSTFFLMFLFAVGYGVGPQFFRGLKSGGLKQVLFAVVLVVCCLITAVLMGKVLRYDAGSTAGLLSGACTISAVLGVASDTINQLGVSADQKKTMIDNMPVAYAVTYLFGTAGSAWILGSLGPKILRVDLPKECKEYEKQIGAVGAEEGLRSAYTELLIRSYRVTRTSEIRDKTVAAIEESFRPDRVFINRIRRGENIADAEASSVITEGDEVLVAARRSVLLPIERRLGTEVDDRELMDIPTESVDVVVTNKGFVGHTLQEIADSDGAHEKGRGVFIKKLMRGDIEMPLHRGATIDRGDVLTFVGTHPNVTRVSDLLGYADRPTDKTDMTFMGFGIVIGALIGAITIHIGGIPLSLSTSGGALFAGLVCGWLRSVNRAFGQIPAPALWVFNNVGLAGFIAVVGITAGPGFVAGLKSNGLTLLLAGVVVTTVPFIVGLLVGKYVFKFHPAINLGACAGARTTTAALGAIEEAAQSKVPALGYTVPYAVGNILLIVWGVVIVLVMK
ncbi:MAG: aspartate-alanine antiporter [Limisphaerales bacterium]